MLRFYLVTLSALSAFSNHSWRPSSSIVSAKIFCFTFFTVSEKEQRFTRKERENRILGPPLHRASLRITASSHSFPPPPPQPGSGNNRRVNSSLRKDRQRETEADQKKVRKRAKHFFHPEITKDLLRLKSKTCSNRLPCAV